MSQRKWCKLTKIKCLVISGESEQLWKGGASALLLCLVQEDGEETSVRRDEEEGFIGLFVAAAYEEQLHVYCVLLELKG